MRAKFAGVVVCIAALGLIAGPAVCVQIGKGKLIPSGPTAGTWKDFQKDYEAYARRTLLEPYKASAKRDAAWDADALSFLDHYAKWSSSSASGESPEELMALGKKAVDAGCDSPIVLTLLSIVIYYHGTASDAAPLLSRALDGFIKDQKLPRNCARLCAIYLVRVHAKMGDLMPEDDKRWRSLALKWTVKTLTDGTFRSNDARIMLHSLYYNFTDFYKDNLKELYAAVKATPKADPYFVKVLGGELEIKEAWDARGTGWGYTVTQEGWDKFGDHLLVARKLYTEAWKMHPGYPEAATAMITVAKAGYGNANDTPRLWFDRAVSAQMDYDGAYNNLMDALRPRWMGSIVDLYAFGVECLNTKRFDTYVPWRFFTVLQWIESEADGNRNYWTAPQSKDRLKTLFDGYEKSGFMHPAEYYRSARAATEWYCGRNDEAKKLIAELGDKLVTSVFKDLFKAPYENAKKSLDVGAVMGEKAQFAGNGHYYEICVRAQGISWSDAKAEAEKMTCRSLKGHLATITSAEEDAFVGALPQSSRACWLGGSIAAADREQGSDKGKQWITGEHWSYSAMDSAPVGTREVAAMRKENSSSWMWTDKERSSLPAFVVEYE